MFNWMMQWSCLYVVLHLLGTCGFLWVLLFPPITQNMHVKIIGYPQLPLLWLRMGCVSVCQSLRSYSQQRLASGSCDPGMNCTSYFSTKHNCLELTSLSIYNDTVIIFSLSLCLAHNQPAGLPCSHRWLMDHEVTQVEQPTHCDLLYPGGYY